MPILEIQPEKRLGAYRLVKLLGEGAFGSVWRAERTISYQGQRLPQICALKVMHRALRPEDIEQASISFMRDWFIGNSVQHKNVVRILDIYTVDGDLCVAMELVDGLTFEEVLGRLAQLGVRLPVVAVLEMGLGVCAGLAAIHEARRPDGQPYNIVHRDIKPSNLMLDRDGDVRVLDLGIARGEGVPGATETGVVKGTARYMAPEQHRSGPVTQRADLFSVGVVLFELVTGEQLFDNIESDSLRAAKVDGRALARVRELDPGLGRLKETLLRCLQPDPAARPPSARALAADLDAQLRTLPRSTLKDLMDAMRGAVPPALHELPEWRPLADALEQPLRPRHACNLAAPSAGLAPVALGAPAASQPEARVEADREPAPPPLPASPPPPIEMHPRSANRTRAQEPTLPEPNALEPTPRTPSAAPEPQVDRERVTPRPLGEIPTVVVPRPAPQEPSRARPARKDRPAVEDRTGLRMALALLGLAVGASLVIVLAVVLLRDPIRRLLEPPPPPVSPTPTEKAEDNATVTVSTEDSPPPRPTCSDDPARPPEPAERCNGRDDDCDGVIPDDERDLDGDGWLACELTAPDEALARPELRGGGDCDDRDAGRNPGATGPEGGADLNCDGVIAPPEPDSDGDGVVDSKDCAKNDRSIRPGARETPADGKDSDCDGMERCYEDNDKDGYGFAGATVKSKSLSCLGERLVNRAGDCDDADPATNVGAKEIVGDGKDNDCDGVFDEQPPVVEPDFSRVVVKVDPSPLRRGRSLTMYVKLADPDRVCSKLYMRWKQDGVDEASVAFPGNGSARTLAMELKERGEADVYFRCCTADMTVCKDVPPYSKSRPLHVD